MRPPEIERLDALLGASMIAHEAIFEMRRELVVGECDLAERDFLLGESAQIVTEELPNMTSTVRALVSKWIEQNLLDPLAARQTLDRIAAEMGRIEPEIEALLERQRQIAMRLRGLLEE